MVFYGVIVDSQTKRKPARQHKTTRSTPPYAENGAYAFTPITSAGEMPFLLRSLLLRFFPPLFSSAPVSSPVFSPFVSSVPVSSPVFFLRLFLLRLFLLLFFSPLVSSALVSSAPVPSPVCFFSACFRPVCAALHISSSKLSSSPVRLLYKNGRAISVMLEAPFINEPMGLCTALRILSAFSHTPLNTLYSTVSGV